MLSLQKYALSLLVGYTANLAYANAPAKTCQEAISNINKLNNSQLWESGRTCYDANLKKEATLLFNVFHIRTFSDMQFFEPNNEQAEETLSKIATKFIYTNKGVGVDEVFKNTSLKNSVIKELSEWQGDTKNYKPSWTTDTKVDEKAYREQLECNKAVRLSFLKSYAKLMQNVQFTSLLKTIDTFKKENPNYLYGGTEENKQFELLRNKQNQFKEQLAMPNNHQACALPAKPYTPSSKDNYEEMYRGTNGIEHSNTMAFSSAQALQKSWLQHALTSEEVENVINSVDFNSEILVLLNFGETNNATENFYITKLRFREKYQMLSVVGQLSVIPPDCKSQEQTAYPFVIVKAPKPKFDIKSKGYNRFNIADSCKAVISGKMTVKPKN